MTLRTTCSPLHEAQLQELVVRACTACPRCLHSCFLSAQNQPFLHFSSHHFCPYLSISYPYFLFCNSLFPYLLYPHCCQLCPFTFLPSATVSFRIIIVLCNEKAKRATEMASSVHQYLLCCFISAEQASGPILLLSWLHSVGLGGLIFPEQCLT